MARIDPDRLYGLREEGSSVLKLWIAVSNQLHPQHPSVAAYFPSLASHGLGGDSLKLSVNERKQLIC